MTPKVRHKTFGVYYVRKKEKEICTKDLLPAFYFLYHVFNYSFY